MERSLREAAIRFGFGTGPLEAASGLDGPHWLAQQLAAPVPIAAPAGGAGILARFQAAIGAPPEPEALKAAIFEVLVPAYIEQVGARFRQAVTTPVPVRERLSWFWSNHFAVSTDKPPLPGLAGPFEDEAIRPHVTGHFADMLIAVLRHPAMLLYLDNVRSVSPRSPLLQRFGARLAARDRKPGLNENLAREVLELHTLGVDGGYDQDDVGELARLLTGWSVGGGRGPLARGEPGRFLFRERLHDPDDKRILGQTYGAGYAEGERALRALALQPATARHLADKLVRHFTGAAQPILTGELERVYLDTGGHLGRTFEALVASESARAAAPGRFRTPEELVAAALRLLGEAPRRTPVLVAALAGMGQRTWTPGSPAGWPQGVGYWGAGDAMLNRIEWISALALHLGGGANPAALADMALGARLPASLRRAIGRADSAPQGLALLLASPAFQWS